MARLTCASCRAPLPQRGARCRNCGWAANYDLESGWRQREALWGVCLVVTGLSLAIGVAVAVAYLRTL